MKAIIILLLFASCTPICKLDKAKVKVTGYNERIRAYNAEGVNNKCYCSFRTDSSLIIGDTVSTIIIFPGSVSGNLIPFVDIY